MSPTITRNTGASRDALRRNAMPRYRHRGERFEVTIAGLAVSGSEASLVAVAMVLLESAPGRISERQMVASSSGPRRAS